MLWINNTPKTNNYPVLPEGTPNLRFLETTQGESNWMHWKECSMCQSLPFSTSPIQVLTMVAWCLRWWINQRESVCILCWEAFSSSNFVSKALWVNPAIAKVTGCPTPGCWDELKELHLLMIKYIGYRLKSWSKWRINDCFKKRTSSWQGIIDKKSLFY